jgi:hypothetical protein
MAGVSMRRQALHLNRISCTSSISRTRGLIRIAASALALSALLPILGAVALLAAPTVRAASCGATQACIHWDGSMIYAGQNNGNPEGPVGEHALVHGEGFTLSAGQQIQLQVVKGDVNNSGAQSPFEFCGHSTPRVLVGQAPVDVTGKFDFNFDWPSAASAGDWSICAYGQDGSPVLNGNIDDGPFRVLSANPPSIALSTNNTQPGQAVTITGKHWLPAQGGIFVYIGPCADCGGAPIVSTTLSSDASGNFSVSLPIPSNTALATYIASAHNTNEQGSVLDLINNGPHLTVAAAAPTATTAPSPTATSAPTATATKASAGNGGGSTSASNGGGSNTGLLIGLVVAIVALLAALAGILAYLATQRRNAAPSGPNGPSGPGGYGPPFGANTNPAGRYGPPDPFAAPYHPPATPPPLPDWDPGATTNPGNDTPDDAPTQAGFFPPPADPRGR